MKKLASVGYTTRRMRPPRKSKGSIGQLLLEGFTESDAVIK